MKVKDGKIKLGKNDYRVGNFIYSNYSDNVTVRDLNSNFTLKVKKGLSMGDLLSYSISQKWDTALQNWAVTMFNVVLAVPDIDYLIALNESAKDCLGRHRDIYGEGEVSDENDVAIIEDLKKTTEAVEQLMEGIGDEGED